MRTETSSSIKTYLECPRKYKHLYIDLIKPAEENKAFRIGTTFHEAVRDYYTKDGQPSKFDCGSDLVEWGLDEKNLWILAKYIAGEEKNKDTAMLLGMIAGYMAKYPKGEFFSYEDERRFEQPVADIGVATGMKDAKVGTDSERDLSLIDFKTTNEDPQLLKQKKEVDIQGALYLWDFVISENKTFLMLKYRIVRKSLLKQRSSESDDAFFKRVVKDYFDRPDFYFQEVAVMRNYDELKAFEDDLLGYFKLMDFSEKMGCWVRNPDSCFNWGRRCEFFNLCFEQGEYSKDRNFIQKERKHEEVKDV